MDINELIAECERLDKEATLGPWKDDHVGNVRAGDLRIVPQTYNDLHFIARSRTLLPLLVKVIKNQQRQIDALKPLSIIMAKEADAIAAELEDVKPC